MKVVQVSDTHLTQRGGVANQNFGELVAFINHELRPDLVVSSGDLSILDPDSAADRTTAHRLHQGIRAPLLVIPGNHDVGEAGPQPWAGIGVTSPRVRAFSGVFGSDHWVHIAGDWALVGVNSEVFSSGLPEEEEQWEWLAGVPSIVGSRPTLLFSHKPLWPPTPAATDPGLCLAAADRSRLLSVLADVPLRIVGSGHLHRYRQQGRDGVTTVSAPSTAFLIHAPELPGLCRLGLVEYRCERGRVTPRFLRRNSLDERMSRHVGEVLAAKRSLGLSELGSADLERP